MLHPITVELLSRSQAYNYPKHRDACQLRNSVQTSESASASKIQSRVDRLRILLLHTAERLSQARIARRTRERETDGRRMAVPSIEEQARS